MKKPHYILKYLSEPETWDRPAFETFIRAEVEASTGALTPSDELLIGSLAMTVDGLICAEIQLRQSGFLYEYNSGSATSPWYKVRTEMIDKAIKILAELGLVARGRPKKQNKVSEVDELFATA